ncbi:MULTISPECIES: hypothetical protein [unclassified Neochlamydia]|uniref:hypothetical protein n=1 Tax=unclassified Neochlamydia TaxID=2643326 RepID=UPI001407FAC0|nr:MULTISPECIES: hypothetical protein [unclassified Neochlamydia]MBS4167283.1 Uncharacterized protein [Neochlamydia sp. AcF65]MBS4169697.1 Uncharacterized protein [Neochlamydia sp. AcF95]NGY95154.1 hypothetical protein [Neochlamydia sp. AcF84]
MSLINCDYKITTNNQSVDKHSTFLPTRTRDATTFFWGVAEPLCPPAAQLLPQASSRSSQHVKNEPTLLPSLLPLEPSEDTPRQGEEIKRRKLLSNSIKYIGPLKAGLPEGIGKLTYEMINEKTHAIFSTTYSGEFHEGRLNGQGLIVYGNGDKLTGNFQHNSLVGIGKLVRRDGKAFSILQNPNHSYLIIEPLDLTKS